MSAETDLQNMLSHASAATVAMSAKAEALVNDAVRALEPFNRFPKGPDFSPKEAGIGGTGTVGGMQPGDEPNFPKLPDLTLPSAPTLRDIEEVFESFSATMPTLTMPSFYYTSPPPIQLRTFRDPNIDTAMTIPDSPDTEVAFDPVTMALSPVARTTLSLPGVEFEDPAVTFAVQNEIFAQEFRRLCDSIFGDSNGLPGVDNILTVVDQQNAPILNSLLPAVVDICWRLISDKQADSISFKADLRSRLNQRIVDEQQRVAILADPRARSGWTLPPAIVDALNARATLLSGAGGTNAVTKFATKGMELSLEVFQASSEVMASLHQILVQTLASQVEKTLEAHRFAVAYAKETTDALADQYEMSYFTKHGLDLSIAQGKLERAEAERDVAQSKLDLVMSQIEIEKALQDNDANSIKNLATDIKIQEQQVSLFNDVVRASKTELQALTLPFDVFDLQVKAFRATIDAHEAQVECGIQEIEADTAINEGRLMEVKEFSAKARAYISLLDAKTELLDAQADRNAAAVRQYSQQVKGLLSLVEQSLIKNDVDLSAYEVRVKDFVSDAKIQIEKRRADMDYADRLHKGELSAIESNDRLRDITRRAELERLSAVADSHSLGANLYAAMAQGAMSSVNSIAEVAIAAEE